MNIDIVKALLDAKVDEIMRLADYFGLKNHPTVSNILKLRELFIDSEKPEKMYVDNHMIGLQNTMADLLHQTTEKGTIMYQKINEAKVFCDILYIQS